MFDCNGGITMRPIKLKMQAFGSYAKTVELDFEKGLSGQKFFLINGATGSGKTTILDAICYALYDKSSGSDKKVENLHSELAPVESKTEVEFTFALGDKIYKIRRNPAQELPKGKANIKKSAELYIDDELVSSDSREIEKLIKSHMGFNAEQFCQVVILPQGKFRDFLMASSDKKMGILNLIFNSAYYEKVERGLKEKSDAAKIEKENIELKRENFFNEVREIGKVDGDINLNDLIEKFSADCENSKAKLDKLKVQSEKAQNDLMTGKIIDEQFNNFDVANKNFIAAKNELEKISADFEKFKAEYDKRQAEDSERKNLDKQINELEKIKNSLAEFQDKKTELEKAEDKEKKSREEILKYEKRQKTYNERLEVLKSEIEKLKNADVDFQIAEQNMKKSLDKKNLLLELDRLKKELLNSQKRLSSAEKNYNDAQKELDRLNFLQKMCTAAKLAVNLQDGEPCPVCGSTSHPNIAVTDEIIPTDEEIEQSEKFFKKKELEKNSATRAVDLINEKINLQTDSINKLADILDFDEAKKIFDSAKVNADTFKIAQENFQKGQSLIEENRQNLDKAQKNFAVVTKNAANLRGIVETMKKQISSEYIENPQKIFDDLKEKLAKKKILDDAWERADKNFHAADKLKSNQEGKIKSAENAKDNAAKKIEGKIKPDIDALKKIADETKNIYADEIKQTSALENNLNRLREIFAKLEELDKLLKVAEKNYQIWGRLSDVANAKNSAKMTFQSYYLNAMFQDVIIEANERLEKMSGGRYQFQNMEGAKKHAKKAGLDLEILDSYTGKARPVETLSGGESFLAALSLALGLAAVVKNSSGGINLDTIFIDEGFGSLDSETLDFAINALTDLQRDSGRLVGIISHVEELKQRIPVQLEIIKNKSGSTARFI